jgi:hypothetical protein
MFAQDVDRCVLTMQAKGVSGDELRQGTTDCGDVSGARAGVFKGRLL